MKIKVWVRKFVIHQGQSEKKKKSTNEKNEKPQMTVKREVFHNKINTLNIIISHCKREKRLKGENIICSYQIVQMIWLT